MSAATVDMHRMVSKNIYQDRKVIATTFQQVQPVYYCFRQALFLLMAPSMEWKYFYVSINKLMI